jgi:hypothetical protein
MVENLELYQTLVGFSAPQWSYSTVEIHGSATLELFFSELELYQTRPKLASLKVQR